MENYISQYAPYVGIVIPPENRERYFDYKYAMGGILINLDFTFLANLYLPQNAFVFNIFINDDIEIDNILAEETFNYNKHELKTEYFIDTSKISFFKQQLTNANLNLSFNLGLNDEGLRNIKIREDFNNAYYELRNELSKIRYYCSTPIKYSNYLSCNANNPCSFTNILVGHNGGLFNENETFSTTTVNIKPLIKNTDSNLDNIGLLEISLNFDLIGPGGEYLKNNYPQKYNLRDEYQKIRPNNIINQIIESNTVVQYNVKDDLVFNKLQDDNKNKIDLFYSDETNNSSTQIISFDKTVIYDLNKHQLIESPSDIKGLYFPEPTKVNINSELIFNLNGLMVEVNFNQNYNTDKNIFNNFIVKTNSLDIKKIILPDNS